MEEQQAIILPQRIASIKRGNGSRNKDIRLGPLYEIRLYVHEKLYNETDIASYNAYSLLSNWLGSCRGNMARMREKVQDEIERCEYMLVEQPAYLNICRDVHIPAWSYSLENQEIARHQLAVYYDFMQRTQ